MQPLEGVDGVFTEMRRLYTASRVPGTRIYGERLVESKGTEYREWNPARSKLAAYLANGGREVPIRSDSRVLYLGASSGTTPSHVSDIVTDGMVYCIEFAPRMFRELVNNCGPRTNMMPLLADATKPTDYRFALEHADIVYEDVAQKGQADILADNMDAFGAEYGMVAVKARSEDVAESPKVVFKKAEERLRERGLKILDSRSLEPFEDSHQMIVVRR
ncbi:MAG: fibrillarin-like rRNA/tRNA 2'-O-methyltransferase [Thermoplasmata archaeon]|nr:fibrillarin-like rRNA/tRNA 2'-O-methyltransferase [Thermoplasmata archaeon]